jgi:hypothetical protein
MSPTDNPYSRVGRVNYACQPIWGTSNSHLALIRMAAYWPAGKSEEEVTHEDL